MRILAISGSLRAASSNTAVLLALRRLAPAGVDIRLYQGLDTLPYFNPDLDGEECPERPAPVLELRREVGECAGILISSPEYAHGVPGVLKNALDWLVSCSEFPGKPVALINMSPRSVHAQASLLEVLTTMSARMVAEASIALQLPRRDFGVDDIAGHAELAAALRTALGAFVTAIGEAQH
jgi:chromate reductase, NAD(P)H dehydrogenase (quinone)